MACQLDANFPSDNGDNKIALKVVKDGYDEITNESIRATDFFDSNGKIFLLLLMKWISIKLIKYYIYFQNSQ